MTPLHYGIKVSHCQIAQFVQRLVWVIEDIGRILEKHQQQPLQIAYLRYA
jgi:hypothetical protein